MLANLKPKRKQAGFIRTNSSRALPTFKLTQTSKNSSQDFSSFQNQPPNDDSQAQFSPYKHPSHPILPHPPLPTKPNSHKSIPPKSLLQNISSPPHHHLQSTKNNYISSPKPGKIIHHPSINQPQQNIHQTKSYHHQSINHIQQIGQKFCLNQSPKSCYRQQLDQPISYLSSPYSASKSSQIPNNSSQKHQIPQQNTSNKKPPYQQQQQQQDDQFQQISFDSHKKPNQNISKSNPLYQNQHNYHHNHQQIQQNNNPKINSLTYQFQSSSISSNSDQNQPQNNYQITLNLKQNNPSHKIQPHNHKQQPILNSVNQYKKLHQQHQILIKKQNPNPIKLIQQQPTTFQKQSNQNNIKYQHQKAKSKFISIKQQTLQNQQPYSQQLSNQLSKQQNQQQQQQLIQQYPKQQFNKISIQHSFPQIRQNPSHPSSNSHPQYTTNKPPPPNPPKPKFYPPPPPLPPKPIKPIQNNNNNDMHKTKGGISFNLDINQFTYQNHILNQKLLNKQYIKKNKKTNSKQEILKRRQLAKNYDRQARAKIFG